eukprot:TRINITY_DN877_c0_g1_i1.p1 TRINITY_DN877_c0_g1~~TRINITY_DN877_c0_g1_i1.p1  ORF type:complete len:126 (-),score=18.40 TRINITY_DN877_c0_g1_i1:282-659(-)
MARLFSFLLTLVLAVTLAHGYTKVLQITCPEGCSTCACAGCKNLTFALGKCVAAGNTGEANATQVGASPFNGYYVMPTCDSGGKHFIETVYLNSKCAGDPITKSTINTEACVRTAGGQACEYLCK